MKKLLLIAAVAMTALFTGCTKTQPASDNLAEKICSMFNQPVDQAVETAKSLGYAQIKKGKVDEYKCYKDTTVSFDNKIELMFNDKNENRVVNVQYLNVSDASGAVSQAKSLAEQTGESRSLNNGLVENYNSGTVDGETGITSYSNFLEKIGNAKSYTLGIWKDSGNTTSIIVMAEINGNDSAVAYGVSIGG